MYNLWGSMMIYLWNRKLVIHRSFFFQNAMVDHIGVRAETNYKVVYITNGIGHRSVAVAVCNCKHVKILMVTWDQTFLPCLVWADQIQQIVYNKLCSAKSDLWNETNFKCCIAIGIIHSLWYLVKIRPKTCHSAWEFLLWTLWHVFGLNQTLHSVEGFLNERQLK